MHIPVLLNEVIKFLDPKPDEFIIDGTIDGGGHSAEILKKISPNGTLLGIDWDRKAILNLKLKILNPNLMLAQGNYADLPEILSTMRGSASGGKSKKLPKADGLLLDLGFSSEQMEESGRGFSFSKNEPLLMVYDLERKPVKEILKDLGEKDLTKIIFDLSGERFAPRIARAIKEAGRIKPIDTSGELAGIIKMAVPTHYERGRIHPATRTFQALRIYANDELKNLERILETLPEILKSGGRAVIISFHSLEDRLVKNYFREWAKKGVLKILTKKPVEPLDSEIRDNPRSRSAKLRAATLI